MKKRWLLSKKSSLLIHVSFSFRSTIYCFLIILFHLRLLFSFSFSRPFNEGILLLCIGKERREKKKAHGELFVYLRTGRARQKILAGWTKICLMICFVFSKEGGGSVKKTGHFLFILRHGGILFSLLYSS